ncbi:MAG TPA: hypothetical protein VFP68_08775 [Burkholderiaceae bacterium]|nr:hypothetical protein [Burkholderiaceae bacterium]
MRVPAVTIAMLLAAACVRAGTGEALYAGDLPIGARLRGDAQLLPPTATRCINCHEAGPGQAPSSRTYAPRLDRETLLHPLARRGGPQSAYDEPSFCRAVREGIDPANMLLRRSMPQYAADDAQCESLWRFLSHRASLQGVPE